MQQAKNIVDCYNKTAKAYAIKFSNELNKKHFDRMLLTAFAKENKPQGKLIDLGCGPGQTTNYLSGCGLTDIVGTDISTEMIRVAKELNPQLHFEAADRLSLSYVEASFGSAVAFYSIVNFNAEQVAQAFSEVKRILKPRGQFLFSFHIGDEVIHLDNFLDEPVSIDFYFLETKKIKALLEEAGFKIIDVMEREPYKDVEYPSKRAYVWAVTV